MVHIQAHSASIKNNPSLLDLCYLNVLKLTTPLLTLLNLFKLKYWGNVSPESRINSRDRDVQRVFGPGF